MKPNGEAVRILEQIAVLQQDSKGNITHILGICNEITSWKKSCQQIASVTSTVDHSVIFYTSDELESQPLRAVLSKRELEIVKLLAQGHSSKFIADKLFISFHTVNTHRQHMIEKTKTKNTGELIQFASSRGLTL
ncbi:response regulator transcription factor [Pontibacter sp. 172403-2]|nr:response regulator transcription factor [Pontibacter sp. 172403-2]